jgi:Uma2 family endonuclease
MAAMAAIPLEREVHYPESDGQPMAETGIHVEVMLETFGILRERYRQVADVWVGANMFLYYEKGFPKKVVAPDVFVVKGVPNRLRRTFKLWEEGRPPCLVIEITSDSTRDEDLHKKKGIYERLGVEEYVLHDPLGDYLEPPLQGFRLVRGRYRPIALAPDGSLDCRTLGLRLRRDGVRLRLIEAATGQPLPWREEVEERVREAEAATQKAETARREAEAARREADAARREADAARQASEAARQEAEKRLAAESAARRALEEELARLRRELGRDRRDG